MLSKLLRLLSLLFASTLIAFVLIRYSPIDPVKQYLIGKPDVSEQQREQIKERWGLNKSGPTQYLLWLKSIVKGDLGESIVYRTSVKKVILERMKNTLMLMLVAWILTGVLGYFLGLWMGMNSDTLLDRILKKICLILMSVPTYWIGLVMLMIFAVKLGWLPIGFSQPIGIENDQISLWQRISHLILPCLTIVLTSFPELALYTRQKTIDVFQSDYVLFSQARGYSKSQILKTHGFIHTIGQAVIIQFTSFASLFGGSILAENVFSYPGLGTAITTATVQSDVPLILGITLFSIIFVFTGNLLADIITGFLNPIYKNEITGE